MSDPVHEFFESIGEQGFDPRLGHIRGTIRIESQRSNHVEHWLVTLDRGAIQVSRDNTPADCLVRTDFATLQGLIDGSVNGMAAMLRGLVAVEGELDLLLYFSRLLGTAPQGHGRSPAAVAEDTR
jgi:predicted lipid carrier protein YhbT